MNEKVKKILSTIANIALWLVIIMAAFFSFATLATHDPNNVGSFLGYTPLSVNSDSMSPTFNSGDLIIIKKCDPNTLQVGDIITFHTIIENQYVLNTHRIQSIEDSNGIRFYKTKGDNNMIADLDMVSNGDIVGQYVKRIPKLGKVMSFLQSKEGFFICLLLPMLGFFIFQVYNLVQVAIKYKKAVAVEAAEEAAKAQARVQAETQNTNENSEIERMKRELEEAKKKLAEAQQDAIEPGESKQSETVKETEAQKETGTQNTAVPMAENMPAAPETSAEAIKEKIDEVSKEIEKSAEPVKPAMTQDQIQEALKAEKRAQILAAKKARAAMLAEMEAEENAMKDNEG